MKKRHKKRIEEERMPVVGIDNDGMLKNRNGMQFDYSEVYRQLRTNVEFSSYEKDLKVICITSTFPSEGKSSVASNLAIMYATKFKNVVLVDCDLRKPVQHKIFNVSNVNGVSNITKDVDSFDVNDDSYFQKFKEKDMEGKLHLVTSGAKVPNPQELLSSVKFNTFIEKLRKRFDYVIIDCPPIFAVSDAVPVTNISDGTIFVCSAKDTRKNEAKSALNQIQRNGAKVIGCVLTKVDDSGTSYSYRYSYGYYR